MYSWLSSNVIQTIGDNINHGINNAVTALENFDDEFNQSERNSEYEDEQNDIEVYKKLLEESQMQIVELSKQFRVALYEKDAELMIWKKKCETETTLDSLGDEMKESITQAVTSAEFEALKSTLQDMEEKMRILLRDKNDSSVKLRQYPELLNELAELRSNLKNQSDNEAKKSDEIDDLVQEYSKLAAESEKQKSSDSFRIKELELENEIMITKLQALEHSIAELADRSTNNSLPVPNSPSHDHSNISHQSRVQSTQLISETDLKQLRAKVLNLEYDLTEKNEKIFTLETALKNNQTTTHSKDGESTSDLKISSEEIKTLELSLSKKNEEINHLQSDITRLQLEKQEAEASGKKFYEQLRALQKEIESEKRKLQDEKNANSQQTQVESEALEAKLQELNISNQELIEKLSEQSTHCDDLSTQLRTLQSEYGKLQSLHDALQQEKNQIMTSSETEILNLKNDLNSQNETLQNLQNENLQFQAQLSSSASDKDTVIAELRGTITTLHEEKRQEMKSYEEKMSQLKSDLETQHQRLLEEKIAQLQTELTNAHEKEIHQMNEKYDEDMTSVASEMSSLKTQIEEMERKFLTEKNELETSHEQQMEQLRSEMRQEGQDLSEKNVAEAIQQAQQSQEKALVELKEMLETKNLKEIEEIILQQQKLKEQELQEQLQHLLTQREAALMELRTELQTETEKKIQELTEKHSEEMKELKESDEKFLEDSLEKLKSENEENLRLEKLNHEREMNRLSAAHQDDMDRLTDEKNAIQEELSKIESTHAEKLRLALEELTNVKEKEKENAVKSVQQEMQSLVDTAYAARDDYLALYTKESKQRKALHNKLMDIQGNIRVICRVRPILDVERRSGEGIDATEILSDEDIVVHRDQSTRNRFEFDRVLAPGTAQEVVFEAVQPLIVSVLDGYNVCIFAYGQTGSGKTFTMEGYGSEIGVSPRAVDQVFNVINNCTEDWSYTVTFSSLEIYNESIRDLLDNSGTKDKLDVRQTPEGNSVPGLTEIPVTHSAEVLDLMRQSQTNRAVGAHDMNEHSSRSHSILTLTCRGKNLRDGSTTFGKLHLIDLAGSERVGKTDATGERLKEAQNINRSLSALGDVINALGKKSTHVPYRNSKLTFLLQDSLGGNSKVLMFVNISPAAYNVGESICSLGFAQRCRSIELGQAKKQTDSGGGGAVKKSSSSASISSASPTEVATPSRVSSSSTLRRQATASSKK